MDYSDYKEFVYPEKSEIVYIIVFQTKNGDIPIYVGQTKTFIRRMGDYLTANFAAAADFAVGTAIKYLSSKGYKIKIKYKVSGNSKKEEQDVIVKLVNEGRSLLNVLKRYFYKTANKDEETRKVIVFVDDIIKRNEADL